MPDKPIPREEPNPILEAIQSMRDDMTARFDSSNRMAQQTWDRLEQVDARLKKVEENSPGSNPPPRTVSGFNAAVRQVSSTTESEADKELRAVVVDLKEKVDTIDKKTDAQSAIIARTEAKTDAQTATLHRIETIVGTWLQNPMVRKIAYVAGGLLLGYLTHLAGVFH